MLAIIQCKYFVFQFAFQKYKDSDIQNFNFAFCFTWVRNLDPTLREEHRLRVFEMIFGHKWDEVTGGGEDYIMRSLMVCSPHQIFFG